MGIMVFLTGTGGRRLMIRKVAGSFSLLLVAVLLVFVAACGSDTAQKEGGEKGGSASEKKEQAAAEEGTSQQSGSAGGGGQPTNIGRQAEVVVNGSSYVSPLTEIFGDVFIGRDNFVAASSVLRASPGHRVELGDSAPSRTTSSCAP
jgi:hypothetical protein